MKFYQNQKTKAMYYKENDDFYYIFLVGVKNDERNKHLNQCFWLLLLE